MGKDIKDMTSEERYEKYYKYIKKKDKVTKSIRFVFKNESHSSKGDFSGFLMVVVVIAAGVFMLYMFCKGFS